MRKREGDFLPLFAALVGALLFLLPTLRYGIARDHALFSYYGWMILRGGPLCANAFVIDMPGAPFLHALQIALLGRSALAMRVFDFAWQAATMLILYAAARMVFSRLAAVCAVWFYAFFYWNMGWWHTCQRDSFAIPWILLMLMCLMRGAGEPDKRRWIALCGICCAGAAFLKGHFLILPIVAGVYLFLEGRLRKEGIARNAFNAALPAVITLLPFACYALWHILGGRWADFRNSFLIGNWAYLHASAPRTLPLQPFLDASRFWLACAALTGLLLPCECANAKRRAIAAIFLITAGLIPFVLRRFFEYHFTSFFCIACVFAGHAMDRFSAALSELCASGFMARIAPRRLMFLLILIAPYFASAAEGPQQFPKELLALLEPGALRIPVAPVVDEDYQSPVVSAVAGFISQRTQPEDSVMVFDIDPAVLYLAERLPPRILQSGAMMLIHAGSPIADEMFARWRAEQAESLRRREPKFVIVPEGCLAWFYPGGKDVSTRLRDFPELADALRENYDDMGKTWYYRIYIRSGEIESAPR
ncbi:MAG TPA: glycosyltransferase family 39 protein [Candidatus Brocadiia bacterium]|nr:glycosyltransferase family 39 protein [Candidatus Brocadiia bacterium]